MGKYQILVIQQVANMNGGEMERCLAQWNRMWEKGVSVLGSEDLYKSKEEFPELRNIQAHTQKKRLPYKVVKFIS